MPAIYGEVVLDIIDSEVITRSNNVTSKSVEDNAEVSDHVENNPITVSITGRITGLEAVEKLQLMNSYWRNREQLAYTGRGRHDACVIESFQTTHDTIDKNGYSFLLDLKILRIAQRQTIQIDLSKITLPEIKAKASTGRKAKTPVGGDISALIDQILNNYQTEEPDFQASGFLD